MALSFSPMVAPFETLPLDFYPLKMTTCCKDILSILKSIHIVRYAFHNHWVGRRLDALSYSPAFFLQTLKLCGRFFCSAWYFPFLQSKQQLIMGGNLLFRRNYRLCVVSQINFFSAQWRTKQFLFYYFLALLLPTRVSNRNDQYQKSNFVNLKQIVK